MRPRRRRPPHGGPTPPPRAVARSRSRAIGHRRRHGRHRPSRTAVGPSAALATVGERHAAIRLALADPASRRCVEPPSRRPRRRDPVTRGRARPPASGGRPGPAARAARAPAMVSVRISPSRRTGSAASQRRKRRLVRTPRMVVSSSASWRRSSASARLGPCDDQLGEHRVVAVRHVSPSSTPVSTRTPCPGQRSSASTVPVAGRKPASGSSA